MQLKILVLLTGMLVSLLGWSNAAWGQQLHVMISGGFSGPYEELLPQFERATGIKVTTSSGSSQGTGPQTIGAQLDRGIAVDMVILSREGLKELMGKGKIALGTDVDLASTPLGIAVKKGAVKPVETSTLTSFTRMLSEAKVVATPASTSGIFLRDVVLPKLGLVGKVNVKYTARGTVATDMVANGEADFAVMPVSEIATAKGVEMAGLLSEEIQLHQTFSAALTASAKEPMAAKQLLAFLTANTAKAAIRTNGMEPLFK